MSKVKFELRKLNDKGIDPSSLGNVVRNDGKIVVIEVDESKTSEVVEMYEGLHEINE